MLLVTNIFFLFVLPFETGSPYGAQTGLELLLLLPQPPEYGYSSLD